MELLDEFAFRFYQELDYNLECENGIRIAEDMRILPMVVIPKNYPEYTSRRVHVAEWIDGEKLSQSKADDVGALVNLGVITYLTQLLDKGFFHAGTFFQGILLWCIGGGWKLSNRVYRSSPRKHDENIRWQTRNLGLWVDDGGNRESKVWHG